MALTSRWGQPAGSGGHGQRRWPSPPWSNHALGVTVTVVADGCISLITKPLAPLSFVLASLSYL